MTEPLKGVVHGVVNTRSRYERKRRTILWFRVVSVAVMIPAIALTWHNPSLLGSVVFGIMLLHITGLYLAEREYNRSR